MQQPVSALLPVSGAAPLSEGDFAAFMAALPDPGNPVAVAVSGGPDSMALAFLLSRWGRARGIAVHVLTVDHGLRPEAAAEAGRVRNIVTAWPGIAHAEILTRNPEDAARPTRLMERARADRYALLAVYCEAHKIGSIFLAHHQDDQAETFLFRLAKGTGIDGLAAMAPVRAFNEDVKLFRPLLSAGKERLIATCASNRIEFISDPSNRNPAFARPRLRNASKALEDEGLTAGRLATTAMRIARARDALDILAARLWNSACKQKETNRIVFMLSKIQAEPEDLRLRILLRGVAVLKPDEDYGPRLERIEALSVRLFAAEGCPGATLSGIVFRSLPGRDELVLERE